MNMRQPYTSRPSGSTRPAARRHAFTLIELLVVISIIALLIAILLPALAQAQAAARSVSCRSQMRQMATSMDIYADDHDDYYPPRASADSPHWVARLTGYYQIETVLVCPDDEEPEGGVDESTREDREPRSYLFSGFNDGLAEQLGLGSGATEMSNLIGAGMLRTAIQSPSEVAIWAEKETESNHFYLDLFESVGNDLTEVEHSRHGERRANYGFADGSVRSLTYPETLTPVNVFAVTDWGRTMTATQF